MITFIIPGNPKPQGRPRFFRRGKFVGTYDPDDSKDFKHKVATYFKASGGSVMEGPISMDMKCIFKRPKRLMTKKSPDGMVPCDKRPDADNLIKAVLDALNGLAYHDDGQVSCIRVWKVYHEKGGAQRTEIRIYPTVDGVASGI